MTQIALAAIPGGGAAGKGTVREMSRKRNGNETRTSPGAEVAGETWLLDLVDDPETDLRLSQLTVDDAVARGDMSREQAEELFMPRLKDPPVDADDLCRMAADILIGTKEPHIDSDAGRTAWTSLRRQIEEIEAQGGIVDFPND